MRMQELYIGLACVLAVSHASAQSTAALRSDGSDISVTIWAASAEAEATVLLVPGWGGGPTDVLGVGRALSEAGVSVVVLNPRGWHGSEGTTTFSNALGDIAAALNWVRRSGRAEFNTSKIVVGGHSWGGGMALAYAASDPSVRRVFSAAGTDHGLFIRQYESDPEYAAAIKEILAASAAPRGPIRFDVEATIRELSEGQQTYGLLENVDRLADRSIMLVGGWDDENVTVDETLLPLYRALRKAGAQDITFKVYQTDHGFGSVRPELQADLLAWIRR